VSGFQLLLQALEPELMGAPVVVDVLDENLHPVAQEAVTVGDRHYFEVPPGRYGLQALLPSGRWLTDSVAVDKRAPTLHVMDLSEISPHESLQRTVVLKSAPFETPGSLNEAVYRSIWVRLWARSEGTWSVERWPQPQASWDSDAVTYWFQIDRRQYMLQLGGPQIPWRMVSLPAAQRLEVSIRPSGSEDEPGLAMTVATDNNLVEALLGYLTIGALSHASLVSKHAEALLSGKVTDPAAAAVGGYYLLRMSDLERLHNWPQNLANWMQWMPDGAVIHAWQLIREQQEAQEPSEDALGTVRDRLLEAVERGIPIYTEGLRLLVAGLKLLDFEADGRDQDVRDALRRVRPFAAAADLGQPTTTFTGWSPLLPSPSATYGMPESHTGLAFLYDVQLQDLVDLGLITAETPLSLLGFSSAPAEARVTAQGTIRLWDGREYSDPSVAAAKAVFSDSWFNWSVPGSNTLAALREQARTGRMVDHREVSSTKEVGYGSAERQAREQRKQAHATRTAMGPPPLTPRQRAAALERAAKARKERADVKNRLKHGVTTLPQVLKEGQTDDVVSKMKVSALLESMPGIGKVRARQIMERLGIGESRRVRGLGPNQRIALEHEFRGGEI
jgi:hypothetical protein